MGRGECFLCRQAVEIFHDVSTRVTAVVGCPKCGTFNFEEGVHVWIEKNPILASYLSCATRQAYDGGERLRLTTATAPQLAGSHRNTPVSLRIDRLLNLIADRSPAPGNGTILNPENDSVLIDATSQIEFLKYVRHLQSRDLLTWIDKQNGSIELTLTVSGWLAAQPFRAGGTPGRCFIIMSFAEEFHDTYQMGIRPAVIECGYFPVQMQEVAENKGITDRILAEVRLAEFVIADFTGQRQSVYFEAGFARGLGREVIWTCRKDEIENLHFDTKHLGHIAWSTPLDLRAKLADSIRANILAKR